MLLICGSRDDRLVSEFLELGPQADLKSYLIEEAELYGSCPFSFERQGIATQGFLDLPQGRVSLNELDGIVLRLRRQWWPSPDFDLQDQMFVYHETTASWFALLDSLRCPVINRFGLGWWLQDLSYPVELRDALAVATGMETVELEGNSLESIRQWPAQPGDDIENNTMSVYRSSGATLPGRGCSNYLLTQVKDHDLVLSKWESETGVLLYRMDFSGSDNLSDDLRLKWIEVQPEFADEPKELVRECAAAALRRIRSSSEVIV